MVAWAFSLAAGGLFPALVLGVWWKRTTSQGAVAGMIAGFTVTLGYLLLSRYFPGYGVAYFGMSSLLNPITGAPVVDLVKTMAAPDAMQAWVTGAHAMASKVGWFNINRMRCTKPCAWSAGVIVFLKPAALQRIGTITATLRRYGSLLILYAQKRLAKWTLLLAG